MLRGRFGLLAASLLAPVASAVETAYGGESALGEVIVTATRAATQLQDMPLHTTVVTREQIDTAPQRSLDQLLRHVPSLLVPGAPSFTTDPTGQNIKFRGMDKKVLVLVDGIPVLDPFYTTVQWYKLPLSSVERVEVVRGGGSSLWGNLAVGGVINVVSRRPAANDGELLAGVGDMDSWNVALSKNFVLSPALSLNITADAFQSDGYDNSPEGLRAAFWPGRATSSATRENLRVALYYHSDAGVSAFLRAGYDEQNELIGGYLYGSNQQQSPDLQAGLDQSFSNRGELHLSLYAQRVNFNKYNGAACYAAATYACGAPVTGSGASAEQQVAPVLQYASSYDLNTYRERGGSIVYTRSPGGALHDWQLGIDYRYIAGEDAQQTYRTPTAALPQVLRIQRANYGAGAQTFTGLFAQLKWKPGARLDFTLGARVDRFGNADGVAQQTNYSNVAVPVAGTTTGGPVPDLDKTAFDPSVAVRFAASDSLAFRAATYKAFRAPGLNNLYRSFGSNAISIANPLLLPETLVGAELGLDWRRDALAFSATLFRADVSGVVATYAITTATPIPPAVQNICGATYTGVPNGACPGTVNFYTNGQDQRATGLELSGTWTVSRQWDLGAYATYTDTDYTWTATGDPTGVQLNLVPKVVAGIRIGWQAAESWSVNANLRYNSDMTLSSLTLVPLLRQGGYAVADASAVYRFNRRVQLSASITNIGDKAYTDASASNPQSISYALPRTASLELRMKL
jgi:outer membrane receptor protein involved in Fe transport